MLIYRVTEYILPTNLTSPDGLVGSINSNVPYFSSFLLFFVFLLIMLSGYFSKARREGSERSGNLPMWGSISGLITSTGSYILFLSDKGLVNLMNVIISVVVTIIMTAWFLFSSDM